MKAWRRALRERTMPPVLLWWVSGLGRPVVVDGHDRIAAALAEGESFPALCLQRMRESPRSPDIGLARKIADDVAAQLQASTAPHVPSERGYRVQSANRLLIDVYDDRPRLTPMSRCWPLGGVARWRAEVRDALRDVGESEVRAGLLEEP